MYPDYQHLQKVTFHTSKQREIKKTKFPHGSIVSLLLLCFVPRENMCPPLSARKLHSFGSQTKGSSHFKWQHRFVSKECRIKLKNGQTQRTNIDKREEKNLCLKWLPETKSNK